MRFLYIFTFWMFTVSVCGAYRILGVFPFNGPSHMIMFQELMKGLAERGHRVDVVSEFPLKTPVPNYTDIFFESGLPKILNNLTYQSAKSLTSSPAKFIATKAGNLLCEKLGSEPIQQIVKNPPKDAPYDVVITEVFGAHCYMAIGHLLSIPVIGVTSADMYPWLNQLISTPQNLAWFPNTLINEYIEHMNFWWRLYNTVHTGYHVFQFNRVISSQDEIIQKHFGASAPSLEQVISNVSLILVNSHIALSGIRDTTPALIEVGGLHIKEDGPPLPENVKKWVDESQGFIYFSFGSMIKIESLPRETLNIIYKALRKLSPIRIVMKIANPEELPPGLPDNILTAKWLPQATILKHPKIKAFITHGGLLSTQEAIYFGVPMIGMPVFVDQYRNTHMCTAKNISIYINLDSLSEEDLNTAFDSILHNPLYRDSMKRVSQKFRDRPETPIEKANYWIEYIIRHGSDSLRSPAMELSWYQIALLDVYLFLLASFLLLIGLILVGLKMINVIFMQDYTSLPSKKNN